MKLIFSIVATALVVSATAQNAMVTTGPVVGKAFAPANAQVKASALIPDTLYVNATGEFKSTVDNLQYTWTFDDGSTAEHSKTVSHSFANVGIYSVKLTVSNGTSSDEFRKNVLVMPVIRRHAPWQPLTIFTVTPNPATDGHFQLHFGQGADRHITVMNAVGDLIMVRDTDELQPEFDISGQAQGIYLVRVEEAGGKTGIKKVVLQ